MSTTRPLGELSFMELLTSLKDAVEANEPNSRQCTEIVRFIPPDDGIECGREAIGLCAYCGTGVCIKHSDTCLEACVLHSGCLLEHEKETGHRIKLEGVCGL